MKRILFPAAIVFTTILVSCESRSREIKEIEEQAGPVDSMLQVTDVLAPAQREQAQEMVEEYEEFAEKYPDDSLAPVYLFKASFIKTAIPDYKGQLEILDKIAATYPKTDYAPQALALASTVCQNYTNDLEKAREYLRKIQADYPDSPYAINIDLQIEYVGDDDGLFEATRERKAEMDSVNAVKKGTGQ